MEIHSIDLPIWKLKKQMCDIGHRIWLRGYCGGNEGNHSIRISDDRVLCTPTNQSKGFLEPEDLCIVDMDGTQVEDNPRGRRRSSEVLMHLAIYKHRSDVKAVVHSHPPHATAFALTGTPIPSGIHPEAEVFLGKIPFAPYATPSRPVLGESVVAHIGPDTNTVVMVNHGTVQPYDGDLDDYRNLIIQQAHYAAKRLADIPGLRIIFPKGFFKEFVVNFDELNKQAERARLAAYVGGAAAAWHVPWWC